MSAKIVTIPHKKEKNERYENRISLQKCKEILGEKAKDYTDAQVLQIRDFLYQIAELDYQLFYKTKNETTIIPLNPVQHDTTESNSLLPRKYRRAG